MSKKRKKCLRPTATRKHELGLPIHVKMLFIFINVSFILNAIKQYILLALIYSLLAIPLWLFPIAYCLLPIAIAHCLLPIAYCILPIAFAGNSPVGSTPVRAVPSLKSGKSDGSPQLSRFLQNNSTGNPHNGTNSQGDITAM